MVGKSEIVAQMLSEGTNRFFPGPDQYVDDPESLQQRDCQQISKEEVAPP